MNPAAQQFHVPYSPQYSTLVADLLKHLTTLSTGSIALEIAFLEKVFVHPKWKVFIAFSLLSFAISIISSLICYIVLVSLSGYAVTPVREAASRQNAAFIALTMAIAGFMIGICAAIVFVLRNLFTLS